MIASWDLAHPIVWLLPVVLLAYTRGFWLVHHQMPVRYPLWRLVSFEAGLAMLVIVAASPLHSLDGSLLFLHMTEHLLLTMVAPPLILLGRPLVPLLRALPPRWLKPTISWMLASRIWRRISKVLTHPVFCWTAFVTALIVWHWPPYYQLSVRSEAWHIVQHACFLSSALLFWWPVINDRHRETDWPQWSLIPYLLTADIANTALSAVFIFSSHLIYPIYAEAPRWTVLSSLDDQALAGAIMWVPGSLAFVIPAVWLTLRLLDSPTRELQRLHARAL
jgi:cytochrome c oxidase assembly factor CtaG